MAQIRKATKPASTKKAAKKSAAKPKAKPSSKPKRKAQDQAELLQIVERMAQSVERLAQAAERLTEAAVHRPSPPRTGERDENFKTLGESITAKHEEEHPTEKLLDEAEEILKQNGYLWKRWLHGFKHERIPEEGITGYQTTEEYEKPPLISYDELADHGLYSTELTPSEKAQALAWLRERVQQSQT